MSHQLQLPGPAQRTTLPRGLHCEDYDSARGGVLYSKGHRQHGRRQQNAKLRDRQRRPIRLRVMHDAMHTSDTGDCAASVHAYSRPGVPAMQAKQ